MKFYRRVWNEKVPNYVPFLDLLFGVFLLVNFKKMQHRITLMEFSLSLTLLWNINFEFSGTWHAHERADPEHEPQLQGVQVPPNQGASMG